MVSAMNHKNILIEKTRKYAQNDIVITDHARLQATVRQIDLEEVKRNILNPVRLVFAEKQTAAGANEEKYNCYFKYSNTLAHRYVIVINAKAVVVTVIKIRKKWQRRMEKYAKV